MSLVKADFYYGALLSQLVNSGFAPAIFEKGNTRRIYELVNEHVYMKVYAKYATKPITSEKESKRWDFSFSEDEVRGILSDSSINVFSFICGMNELKGSEICFVAREQLVTCLGIDYSSPNRRVAVFLEKKGSRNYIVYGTGLERKENALKIIRNFEKRLQEFVAMPV